MNADKNTSALKNIFCHISNAANCAGTTAINEKNKHLPNTGRTGVISICF